MGIILHDKMHWDDHADWDTNSEVYKIDTKISKLKQILIDILETPTLKLELLKEHFIKKIKDV